MSAQKTEIDAVVDYPKTFAQIKKDIEQSQIRSALSVTKELSMLYWRTGKILSEKIIERGWGAKIIKRLESDLKKAFPNISGFSNRNLHYMRKFAERFSDLNCAAVAAQIPWGHNMLLLDRLEGEEQHLWYVHQIIANGWSRSSLETWMESDLYRRQGKAITNFKETLPEIQSDLAEQALKDPYNFSFLALDKKYRESDLEQGLIDHIQKFLLELGDGFAFVGRQYEIQIAEKEYVIDLLFYHLKLRCYFVIELKAAEFNPRDAGQINFYLSAVDDLLRHSSDNPTIGILICKKKNHIEVEYALRRCTSPISVASYETKLVKSLPKDLKSSLPTTEEIEAELASTSHKATVLI